jgi:dephospho-CoA kinase
VGRQVKTGKPVIGVAGGIGSGKSTVAAILGQLGAGVISSDQLNHAELDSPEVLAQIRDWWGDRFIDATGRVDRDALRELVQGDDAARRRLESLTHPRIAARRQRMMAEFLADDRVRAIVWDSPLLFEAGLADRCDYIIFVDADPAQRLARVRRDRGWTEEDLERFEKLQKPLDFKRQRADYIVDNNSDIDVVHREVESVFSRILSAAKASCG